MAKITFTEVSSKPPAPSTGQVSMYVKNDEVVYIQDSTGTEIALGTASGITSLTGEATATGPGAAVVTLSNDAVIGKVLTGFTSGPNSAVVATDTLLQAIQKLQAQLSSSTSSSITGLTGDVSATGPGNVSATVNSVGGSAAADIHNAELLANAATSLNVGNDIVKRDNTGSFAATTITSNLIGDVTGNAVGFTGSLAGDVTGSQSATVVSSVGGSTASAINTATIAANAATASNVANTILKRSSLGTVTVSQITATSGFFGTLNGSITGNAAGSAASFTGALTGDVSGHQFTTTIADTIVTGKKLTGYSAGTNTPIASTDTILGAFGKVQGQINSLGSAEVTAVTATTPLTSSGGSAPNIAIQQSNTSQDGYLSAVDWNTFNSKSNTIPNQAILYVSVVGGNDSTGVPGDITKPFASVTGAMTAVTDNSTFKRYCLQLAPGDYFETSLVLKPFVSIKGATYASTRIRPTNAIALDPSWDTPQARAEYEDVYFLGGAGLNLDFSAISGISNPGTVEFMNCWCNASFSVTGVSGLTCALNMFNCNLLSTLAVTDMGGACYLSAVNVNGLTTLSATNRNQALNILGSTFSTGMSINASSTFTETSKIVSNYIATLSLNGSGVSPFFSVTSLPTLSSSVTLTSGATYNLLDGSYGLNYTPTTSSNWPTVPTTTQQALDTLAVEAANTNLNSILNAIIYG